MPPGWAAINQVFKSIYCDQKSIHYGTTIKYKFGGPDPLDGVSVYRSDKGVSHWHYFKTFNQQRNIERGRQISVVPNIIIAAVNLALNLRISK